MVNSQSRVQIGTHSQLSIALLLSAGCSQQLRYSIRRRRLETQTSAMFGRNQFRLYDEVFMRFTPANSYISAHCCWLPGPVAMLLLRSNELVRSEKGLPPLCGAPAARRAAVDIRQQQQHNLLARKSLFPTPT